MTSNKIDSIVIVCSGEDYNIKKLKQYCSRAQYIIAVDNGLALLNKIKIKPDLIIGDLDSVNKKLLDKYKYITIEKYPADKDLTDSELAILKGQSLNPKNIYLFAATGSYFDHSFANVINIFKYRCSTNFEIITNNSTIYPIFKEKTITGRKNHRFSIFPITDVYNFSMKGAKYTFNDNKKHLYIYDYSISNVIISDNLNIKFRKGNLFLVLYDKGFN
jgi:thiamine pyrophosphokinase